MSTQLRSTIEQLADAFVSGVLAAMRKAPLEEILDQTGRSVAKAAARATGPRAAAPAAPKAKSKTGRLARRSPEELSKVLDDIVALLQKNPEGLRAEQIRDQLNLISKELPRPLADGVAAGRLRKTGEKRATTYFATGKGGGASGAKRGGKKK
jgi:hypothetical protein